MWHNWRMTAYYNDVNEWLSVGGDIDLARDLTRQDYQTTIAQLREHGVTHVIDLRSEWSDESEWVAGGLDPANYSYIPIVDSQNHSPSEAWFTAVEAAVCRFWLESSEGDRLLTFCHMGINRSPSAAMLALLTVDPLLDPFEAFLKIREARPAAGLVYAEAVGIWHLLNAEGVEELTPDDDLPESVVVFSAAMKDYWTPEMIRSVNRGIAYYRSQEGSTTIVKDGSIEQRLDAIAGL